MGVLWLATCGALPPGPTQSSVHHPPPTQHPAPITRRHRHLLQTEVLSEANVRALRESVQTLSKTLAHIERITGDLGGLTSDKRVTGNLKQLIEALSRLVAD